MSDLVQNILYVTRDGCYLHHELDAVKVEHADETLIKIPIHHLQGITIMSRSSISPSLLHKCLRRGVFITFLTANGRFLGRLDSAGSGNVHLRKAQFRVAADDAWKLRIARCFVAGKIQNARINLLRSAREAEDSRVEGVLRSVVDTLERSLNKSGSATTLNELRGFEGEAARAYFSAFDQSIRHQKDEFHFDRRTRRPPRSRVNALLSFLYSMITNDCVAACQAAGLDAYVGFLHEDRSGRPSLALDLTEEFRAFADRCVITLINRKQVQPVDIDERPGGVYMLTEAGRRKVIGYYQERKSDSVAYPLTNAHCRVGDLFLYQARVLARVIRGDIGDYLPYIWK